LSSAVPLLVSEVLGRGPGSGMAAMLLIAGVCEIAAAIAGMAIRPIRDIDPLIPDLDTGADEPVLAH
jgi:MFS transporter, DHA3 family, macrolide efflux protein